MRLHAIAMAAFAACVSLARADDLADRTRLSALADGLTTAAVLASGGVELNPLVPVHPLGLAAITALKYSAPDLTQDPKALRALSSVWGGASVNNLAALVGLASPIGLALGFVAGAVLWNTK